MIMAKAKNNGKAPERIPGQNRWGPIGGLENGVKGDASQFMLLPQI
jgi:hypothetical protein